ncbi:hypothetical protein HHI36_014890 [Cryptolaemus montrouzieri]|uniref:MI domain-containing protein n=1 Tax=Cryptolaemus montrouzieri TaxID=559131 RepID=A0ABD2N567_9CUCU
MINQRNTQLTLANEMEDRNIKKLEKQLKLNKRISKGIPKSFTEDGLDYLLQVCNKDEMKSAVVAEQQFADFNDDFEEDLALMTGKSSNSKNKSTSENNNSTNDAIISEDSDSDYPFGELEETFSEESTQTEASEDYMKDLMSDYEMSEGKDERKVAKNKKKKKNIVQEYSDDTTDNKKKKQTIQTLDNDEEIEVKKVAKKKKLNYVIEESENDPYNISQGQTETEPRIKGATKINDDGTWEDIYGRLRAEDGSLITSNTQKYIPPAVRESMEQQNLRNNTLSERLNRLRKQVKGLINRLTESNMHSIATQLEGLYMNNSRNDMNDSVTKLILESVVTNIITPERLLMEHVLLIAILHANIGTEVGAHFLQTIISKFDESNHAKLPVDDKTLDNIVIVLAQLYNFKLFDSKLIYEILNKLAENFIEKNIDCILHILRNVGFNLRKDDPLSLRDLILDLQKKAATISANFVTGSRVKYLLDILYSEHLKKIMKGFIRKGNYIIQLNITLEDLLKAEEKGKWWVVGSAWNGNVTENKIKTNEESSLSFSQKLLKLAAKQRMNTDTRRNIFCVIMSAEDYLDAFEKLLHLGLKNNQEREIIHVILHCCLQENPYNKYYAVLAQKFCDLDRKYQLTIKYSIWDKLKALGEQSTNQLSNLAKLLTHLFLEKGLPISTLKIVQFSELDKLTLRFIRQILLGILLHEDIETCTQVFEKVSQSDKLKMFRESLRLFIHHFLLKNVDSHNVDEKQKTLLETRSKIIEKMLVMKNRSKF